MTPIQIPRLNVIVVVGVLAWLIVPPLSYFNPVDAHNVRLTGNADGPQSFSPSPSPTPSPTRFPRSVIETMVGPGKPLFEKEPGFEAYLNEGLGTDDADCDGIKNVRDNCTLVHNPDQKDSDDDGIGDACDEDVKGAKEIDLWCDFDKDGVFDSLDNCSSVYNPDQKDSDNDHIGDACEADITKPAPARVKRFKSSPQKKH